MAAARRPHVFLITSGFVPLACHSLHSSQGSKTPGKERLDFSRAQSGPNPGPHSRFRFRFRFIIQVPVMVPVLVPVQVSGLTKSIPAGNHCCTQIIKGPTGYCHSKRWEQAHGVEVRSGDFLVCLSLTGPTTWLGCHYRALGHLFQDSSGPPPGPFLLSLLCSLSAPHCNIRRSSSHQREDADYPYER
ncbi:hypothetical protein BD289DRAFT_259679 [Coniella lustricola]|uniref:Uncharacterized protein n=1 Tax=Coniella lustricola TaxID=2025994 RepID=A0A2T3A818_9PEZI|nr:hypothetical protein BD289DRAFT_259679 [Coniella lustricola]